MRQALGEKPSEYGIPPIREKEVIVGRPHHIYPFPSIHYK